MSDTGREDIVPKGNEWEVVALTESAYAAAPSVKQETLDYGQGNLTGGDSAEVAQALLMSGHFAVAQSTHENLLLEPEDKEKCSAHEHDVPEVMMQQGGVSDSKHEDNLNIEGLISDEYRGAPQIGEKGRSDMAGEDTGRIPEPFESLDHPMDPGMSNVQKQTEEDEFNNKLPVCPGDAWWRRHASCLYCRAKNANPFWSIVVAAAVVGLVIIGHRWQQEKPQVFLLKSQMAIDDEGSGWILSPMARLKDVSLAGQHSLYI